MKTCCSAATVIGLALFAWLPGRAEEGLWLDARVKSLPSDKLGPFFHTSSGDVLAIDTTSSYISTDGGKTWSAPRPLLSDRQDIKVSNERAVYRTREGTIIAAFMNLAERHWTWSSELWITTMQGGLRVGILESAFVAE